MRANFSVARMATGDGISALARRHSESRKRFVCGLCRPCQKDRRDRQC